jgi:hypothetical protein
MDLCCGFKCVDASHIKGIMASLYATARPRGHRLRFGLLAKGQFKA